jgi:hypothetical protein
LIGDVLRDDGVDSLDTAVIFAGPFGIGLEEAGGMSMELAGMVGMAIVSALVKAIGGSHEPRQSRPHVAQAGSMSLICVGTTSCGWKSEGVMMPHPEATHMGIPWYAAPSGSPVR